jgi:hypothetical protein
MLLRNKKVVRYISNSKEVTKAGLLLSISLLSLMAISCKKDKFSDQNPLPQNNVFYKDFLPDKEMQSLRSYSIIYHSICSQEKPIPRDSVINVDLDLDNDRKDDFRIIVKHNPYSGYCGHCESFTYNISIEGLSSVDSIAKLNNQYPIVKIFAKSDSINSNNSWVSRGDILLSGRCLYQYTADFDEGFIGVKIKKCYGYIHIKKLTNNGIQISEHGFNKAQNSVITCGQIE